jgi:hypothetical protein
VHEHVVGTASLNNLGKCWQRRKLNMFVSFCGLFLKTFTTLMFQQLRVAQTAIV